ncbi:stage V sporulation protein AA [Alkalicoccobacillus gibsonii]|jgi:stage V sporulation protein AA|uniref:stage V sporulation protein AA n=1 Tax=Alkalicoccobacillus gibsonii TaxID=79881 RepID=UPI001934A34F|nr:stage V sporulation protein AA [Alkalicoccobacillus gibsonii]MBM0064544.1 stage V sporulation protein AA [Alkalicoccobacillus gibsonii]
MSLEDTTLFVRMKPRIDASLHQVLTLHQLANLSGDQTIIKRIGHLAVYQIQPTDGSRVQIDIMTIIASIHSIFPKLDIQVVGSVNTVVYVRQPQKRLRPLYIALVWLLLFVGSGLAVMNFHEDVSMRAVHIRLYYLVTGEETLYPLWLQIPYSLGLGIGMVLFFNHFFKKRFNDEPSPLDVEMFNYQQNLDQYVVQKDKHDH